MDLDKEELKETRKHKKKYKQNYFNTTYYDLKKLRKIYNVTYDFEIFKKEGNNED